MKCGSCIILFIRLVLVNGVRWVVDYSGLFFSVLIVILVWWSVFVFDIVVFVVVNKLSVNVRWFCSFMRRIKIN